MSRKSRKKSNSQALRQLAEELLLAIAEDEEIPEDERASLVTSLVRQWITYDGNATLFFGEQQLYLVLGKTPLGRFSIVPEAVHPGWLKLLREERKINPEAFPDLLKQLNLSQSVEVTNTDGVPLRLWVNPRTRTQGVEPLVKQPVAPGRKRDYRKMAIDGLENQLGMAVKVDEMEALAGSVTKQWQLHQGHACLFLNGRQQLFFTLTERADGRCTMNFGRRKFNLESILSSYGFAPEAVPEVIVRLNLGQKIEFRDSKGIPSILSHDPKNRRIKVEKRTPAPQRTQTSAPPLFCPKCTAVLKLWKGTDQQQTCPHCGHTVSRC